MLVSYMRLTYCLLVSSLATDLPCAMTTGSGNVSRMSDTFFPTLWYDRTSKRPPLLAKVYPKDPHITVAILVSGSLSSQIVIFTAR